MKLVLTLYVNRNNKIHITANWEIVGGAQITSFLETEWLQTL